MYDGDEVPDKFEVVNDERNKLLMEMTEHVEEFTAQRDLLKSRSEDAKSGLLNGFSWPDRRGVFVADYSQGMGLPHHGNEQPGET